MTIGHLLRLERLLARIGSVSGTSSRLVEVSSDLPAQWTALSTCHHRYGSDHLLAQWRYRLSHRSRFHLLMMRRLVRLIRLVAGIGSISDNPSSHVVVGSDLLDRWTA